MSKTPKINRVWNKQEKRIVRLLYRKGFDIDLSTCIGPPIKRQERSTDVKILRLAIWVIVTKFIFVLGTIGENVKNIL